MTTPEKTGRINARLPPELARKISYLQARTHKSATALLHESIERLYQSYLAPEEGPAALLEQAGFIGCADGPADLSSSYKRELGKSWSKKA